MKKILILISILVSMTGGIVFYSQSDQEEMPKPKQVNVSEEKAEDKVASDDEQEESKLVEDEKILEEKKEGVKEEKQEVKSDPKPDNKSVSSASNSKIKTENKASSPIVKDTSKETPKVAPKENNNTPSSNSSNTEKPKNNVTTSLYDSITGGKKDRKKNGTPMTESECFARGTEIQNKELDYVLDYNEQHPEAPIQPDINYFRVYPVIDDEGTGYYLHFFCVSGEGNDAKLKNMY